MPRVVRSTIIDAPVERLWAVLRDFNGHKSWHPIVAKSTIERGYPSDKIGCVRRFTMQDGAELREQLLALSDIGIGFLAIVLFSPDGVLGLWDRWRAGVAARKAATTGGGA